jgi:hypothetical protein
LKKNIKDKPVIISFFFGVIPEQQAQCRIQVVVNSLSGGPGFGGHPLKSTFDFNKKISKIKRRLDPSTLIVVLAGFEIMYHAHEHITQNLCYLHLMLLIQCFYHHWAKLISFRFFYRCGAHDL